MNGRSLMIARIGQALSAPNDDVGRLVEELLAAARAHRMKIDWNDGTCEISELGVDASLEQFPVSESVFRGVLDRIAALCIPGSTSATAYAGAGEIDVGHDHRISVAYSHGPDRQWLCLGPVVAPAGTHSKGSAATHIATP